MQRGKVVTGHPHDAGVRYGGGERVDALRHRIVGSPDQQHGLGRCADRGIERLGREPLDQVEQRLGAVAWQRRHAQDHARDRIRRRGSPGERGAGGGHVDQGERLHRAEAAEHHSPHREPGMARERPGQPRAERIADDVDLLARTGRGDGPREQVDDPRRGERADRGAVAVRGQIHPYGGAIREQRIPLGIRPVEAGARGEAVQEQHRPAGPLPTGDGQGDLGCTGHRAPSSR